MRSRALVYTVGGVTLMEHDGMFPELVDSRLVEVRALTGYDNARIETIEWEVVKTEPARDAICLGEEY